MNYKHHIKTARDKYLTTEEFAALLQAVKGNAYWYMLFYLQGNLGLRVGEVVRLRTEHLDTANCSIKIPTLKQEGHKGIHKGSISRNVIPKTLIDMPVSEVMMEKITSYLTDHRYKYKGKGWLFPYKDGGHVPEYFVRRAFKSAIRHAKLSPIYSPHSLRHCKGIQAYRKLKDIRAVQALLRHRNISSTVTYTHLDLEAKRELTNELDVIE